MMSISPAAWLVDHAQQLPPAGTALDVACGRGRNALWLARRGLDVHAVDRDPHAIAHLTRVAADSRLPITARVVDLETDPLPSFEEHAVDLVVGFNYLHRPLFPALLAALRVGGLLVYETFTREQALRGRPRNPQFLLEPGELRRLVHPLAILAEREGVFDGRCCASVIARKVIR